MDVDIQLDIGLGPYDIVVKISRAAPKPLQDFVGSLISSRYNLKAAAFIIHVREFEEFRRVADSLEVTSRDASDAALDRIAEWEFRANYDQYLKTEVVYDPKELGLKTELFSDQVRGVQFLSTRQRSLNADSMGVGKSLQAIATYARWRQCRTAFSVMVISINSVKYGWMKEVRKHSNFTATMLSNGTEKILQEIELYRSMPTDFLVLHYEALCDKKNRVLEALLEIPTDAIFIDEAHLLKNTNTIRYKNVARLVTEAQCSTQGVCEVTYESGDGVRFTRLERTGMVLGQEVDNAF